MLPLFTTERTDGEREPRYSITRIVLSGSQPLVVELGFPADFISFIDTSEIDPNKVYVAFNEPLTFIPLSKVITARAPKPFFIRILLRWEPDQEGRSLLVYYAGAPSIEIGTQVIAIGADYTGILKKGDLSFDSDGNLNVNVRNMAIIHRGAPSRLLDSQPVDPGSYVDVELTGLDEWAAMAITARITYDPGAARGVRILWLHSPDGSSYDSEDDAVNNGYYYEPSFAPGETRQATVAARILAPHVKVRVRNLDTSTTATVDLWVTLLR